MPHAEPMQASPWFSGSALADPREAAFVRALATHVADWAWSDLTALDTSTTFAYDNRAGCLVEVQVPKLTSPRRILRVLYEPDDEPQLRSEWSSDGYAFDRPVPDEHKPGQGELYVAGLDVSPEQYALFAARWFERQLRRRIVRQEWDRPPSRANVVASSGGSEPAAVRWMISDPEEELSTRGGLRWWRLMRQSPTRELTERA